MKKNELNANLLDMALWHGVLEEFDSTVETLRVPCPRAEKFKEYSDDIINKRLELLEQEYIISKKPLYESDFVLDSKYSKAEHYRQARQRGIQICKKFIEDYYGGADA